MKEAVGVNEQPLFYFQVVLSVLIPVYNFDVRNLVETLRSQCRTAQIDYEIICIDDNSKESFRKSNEVLKALSDITWIENEKNKGRSAIRNQLSEIARYPFMIFLDCDSTVDQKEFIQNYLQHLPTDKVLVGGRRYENSPSSPACYLHWLYGSKREQRSEAGFQSNNFLIPKSLFQIIRFDEKILRYGHEDTIFGNELLAQQIPVVRINNPVIHSGLEDAATFLRKQEIAIENLISLEKENRIDTKLQRTIGFIRKLGLPPLLLRLYHSQKDRLKKKLLGPKPSLLVLDLYKIGYYLMASARK